MAHYNDSSTAREPKLASEVIEDLLRDKTKRFLLIKSGKEPVELSDLEFAEFDGFGIDVKNQLRLSIPTSKLTSLFPKENGLVERLDELGLLHFGDGKRFKKRIRIDENNDKPNDSFYVIKVDQVLLQAACRRSKTS